MPKKNTKNTTKENINAEPSIAEQVQKLVDLDAEQLSSEDTEAFEVTEITLAKFKKLFKNEIKETADWLDREDKEGDFKSKKELKEAALSLVQERHPEYTVVG